MAWGCISAHGMCDVKEQLMQRLILEFWRDICCRQENDFSQELHISAGQCQASFCTSYNSVAS